MASLPHDPEAIELLADLIRIDSSNPDLVSTGPGEAGIADYIEKWFSNNGFECHRLESTPGRPSVVGIVRGSGGGRTLMLNGHIDTVSLTTYDGDALDPVIRDECMFGRGSFDMKAGIAAMMLGAKRAHAAGTRGDIIVACVADEEANSAGTIELLQRFTADGAIISEPSHLEVTLSHKGFAWFDVIIHGRAAHGSRPELGIDAIAKAGYFLVALEEYAQVLSDRADGGIAGTVHASLISGGQEFSSYPAECRISVERRTVAGETPEGVTAELAAILDGLSATVKDFSYSISPGLSQPPFRAQLDSAIVQTTLKHAEIALGHQPVHRSEPFWTDCALLDQAGIPCLLFGVDGGGAHAATEWVTLSSLALITEVMTTVALDFCNQG